MPQQIISVSFEFSSQSRWLSKTTKLTFKFVSPRVFFSLFPFSSSYNETNKNNKQRREKFSSLLGFRLIFVNYVKYMRDVNASGLYSICSSTIRGDFIFGFASRRYFTCTVHTHTVKFFRFAYRARNDIDSVCDD